MKIIYNKFIPFKEFNSITIFPFIFTREECKPVSQRTLTHETIHALQQKELLLVFFYILYGLEYLFWLLMWHDSDLAYKSISFEKEAYEHQDESDYPSKRKHFAQWRS